VHETTESISSQWSNDRAGGQGSAACGRALMERSVGGVVLDVLTQDQAEVAWSGDQYVVEAFAS